MPTLSAIPLRTSQFIPYDDHRMPMSLSPLALRHPNITINDSKCFAKTYPNFFQHLRKLYV